MNYLVTIQDNIYQVEITQNSQDYTAKIDAVEHRVECQRIGNLQLFTLLLGNRAFDFELYEKHGPEISIGYSGRTFNCLVEDERLARLKSFINHRTEKKGESVLKSAMPGLIVAIEVKEGQHVRTGQGLMIMEAMKMENELKATFDARIKEIKVKEKQAVEKDEVLIVFE